MLPRPKKRFGQHFLTDRHYLQRIVAAIDPRPDDRFFEIGPGPGALTLRLAPRVEHLTAVEVDRDMVAPRPGDLLAIMSAGAYGAVQAGTYNTRALVPEVLVRDAEWALVRPRLEVDALIARDRLPAWL